MVEDKMPLLVAIKLEFGEANSYGGVTKQRFIVYDFLNFKLKF